MACKVSSGSEVIQTLLFPSEVFEYLKERTTSGKEAMKEIHAASSWECQIYQWRNELEIKSKKETSKSEPEKQGRMKEGKTRRS